MATRSIGEASIVFGLVSIPVKVFSTSEPSHEVHFHMVHAGCGERLKQQYVCPKHGKVDRDEMAKGYEPSKGAMIELDKSELAALDAVGTGEISLREFVPASAVDPIYIDRTYYLGPGKGGGRPYRLLRDTLEDSDLVGVASYAARGKAYVVMVRPYETGLAMHQLRYQDEIKPWSAIELDALPKPAHGELELAKKLVAQLRSDTFDPTEFTDEVKTRVKALLAAKVKSGEAIEVEPTAAPAAIPDLMAALRASLGDGPATKATKAKSVTSAHTAKPQSRRDHKKRAITSRRTSRVHAPPRSRSTNHRDHSAREGT